MSRDEFRLWIALSVVGFFAGLVFMRLGEILTPEQIALAWDYAFAFARIAAGIAAVFLIRAAWRWLRAHSPLPTRPDPRERVK